jgi:hypothetical protein
VDTYKLTATYYSLKDGLSTTIMLNNKGPEPILASPTIYSLAGTRLSLAPITVPGSSYIDVDMHQLLAGQPEGFREGSMKIAYSGGAQQLGAQVKMIDPSHNLIWAEQFVYTTKYKSSRLENVWWLPYEDAKTRVAVSNTSANAVTATLTVSGTSPQQTTPLQIILAPWETRVLDILRDFVGNENGTVDSKGGISIAHSGAPGAVLARMFIAKPSKGYSAAVNFIDPESTASQKWNGAGLRFRNLDGAQLSLSVAARNTGTQTSHVGGRIIYTQPNGDVSAINLPQKSIPAGTAKVFELEDLIDDLPASVTYGGIELQYDTPKGTIITSVQSVGGNGDHVFQVPMFDPANMPSSAGGFPWKADGDFRTIVYIKNETDAARKYTAYLIYDGGQYTHGVKELKPGATVAIDFRELRDAGTPDSSGGVIPLNLQTGQIAWSSQGREDKTMSGRSEQVSVAGGLASSYACANNCREPLLRRVGYAQPGGNGGRGSEAVHGVSTGPESLRAHLPGESRGHALLGEYGLECGPGHLARLRDCLRLGECVRSGGLGGNKLVVRHRARMRICPRVRAKGSADAGYWCTETSIQGSKQRRLRGCDNHVVHSQRNRSHLQSDPYFGCLSYGRTGLERDIGGYGIRSDNLGDLQYDFFKH